MKNFLFLLVKSNVQQNINCGTTKIKCVTKKNCVAKKFALPNVDLLVEKDYEKLITGSLLQKLEILLKGSLGEDVKLTAQVGVLGSETPRKRKMRLQEEKIEKRNTGGHAEGEWVSGLSAQSVAFSAYLL